MAFSLVFYCSLFKLYIITHIIFVNLFNNFHTFIIKFVYYKFITIGKIPGDIYTYTRLVYSEETIILDHEYNEIGIEDLKIGDTVVAFHSNAMTMSIPPQTSVFIIEVK